MKDDLNKAGTKGTQKPKTGKTRKEEDTREESLDQTIEDSFPASDPPSSIPDPDEEEAA